MRIVRIALPSLLALAACETKSTPPATPTPIATPTPTPPPTPAPSATPTLTDAVPPQGAPAAAAAVPSPAVPIAEAVKGVKGKGTLLAKLDVETTGIKGTFTCELFEEKAPITVANFVALARGLRSWRDAKSSAWVKKPLYDGSICHRVIPNFMIQCGDPEGSGKGGPGFEFDDEIRTELNLDKGGVLAMANKGVNRMTGHGTNGSQFFITEVATPWLNGHHTVFGQCDQVELEKKLARVPSSPGLNRPTSDVVIKKVTIVRGKPGK